MDLKQYGREVSDEVFRSAVARGRKLKVPWGRYNVALDRLSFGYSRKGAPMITISFRVLDGDYTDQIITSYWVTVGDWQMERVTDQLTLLANSSEHAELPFTDIKKCEKILDTIKNTADMMGYSYTIEYYPSGTFPVVDILNIHTQW